MYMLQYIWKLWKSGQPLLKAPNAPVPMRPLFGGSTTILSVLLSFLHSIANDSKHSGLSRTYNYIDLFDMHSQLSLSVQFSSLSSCVFLHVDNPGPLDRSTYPINGCGTLWMSSSIRFAIYLCICLGKQAIEHCIVALILCCVSM